MLDSSFLKILNLNELGGDLAKIRKSVRGGKNTCVFSAIMSQRVHISWGLDEPIIYVVQSRERANQVVALFREFFGSGVGALLEREESITFKSAVSSQSAQSRIKTLYGMACGEYKAVVVTADVLMQYLPSKSSLTERVIKINKGADVDIDGLMQALAVSGYERRDVIENRGEFTLRGDILSIFPKQATSPVRVTFFGDTVERIRFYDVDTMENMEDTDSIAFYPSAEFSYSKMQLEEAMAQALHEADKIKEPDAKKHAEWVLQECALAIEMGKDDAAINYLLPYLRSKNNLFNYLQEGSIVVYDDAKLIHERMTLYHKDFSNRCEIFLEGGDILPVHKNYIIDVEQTIKNMFSFTQLGFVSMTSANPIFKPQEIYNLQALPVNSYYMNFQTFFTDLRSYNISGYSVVVSCGDEYTAKHIKGQLFDENIYATVCDSIDIKIPGIIVTTQTISNGFVYKSAKLVVIGRDELIRKRESVGVQAKKKQVFTMPKCGDYVVHEVHGIGMCSGIERIKQSGVEKDYVVINYSGADKLYIAVDQMDRLSRYSGADVVPKLSKIGGKDFQKAKDSVKASVKAMAINLVELYKARQESKGFVYGADTIWQQEFEDAFQWEETPDQLKAIAEVKSDMENGIVMDRLLCGDVGYGKTEVALRAVFKTVMDGKQAAILAPTAILARQHFNTAMARFNEAKLKCVLLTRFQTKEDIEKSLAKIRSGEASVIIGTHRLMSSSVKFHDLGLLVLDEEQRFGVEHKEKLKITNKSINVLTLSATPIPRTLNMALTGVRDISVLETPPMDRLPIETYVAEMTDSLLSDAINREIDRDGQVFVLYNRVEDIEKVADKIRKLVPRSKVIIGHGQMDDISLENAINAFYNKEGNVLVATTIIENGIDLPDANTLLVYDADKLGLSALYQLRGRVGRSNRLAYAYFTTRQSKVLTEDATKRLTALMDYTDFGSGFKIAMRDLEIRGAGNVLGREQHGHIVKVGYDMYCKLLQEAVEEVSGAEKIQESACEMNVDINSYLDASYIPNNNEKIKVYKTIAEISCEAERDKLINKLSDTYGLPNQNLLNLIEVALIKNLAGSIGAKRVTINKQGAGITFDASVYKNKRVILAVADRPELCVMSDQAAPILVFDVKNLDILQKMQVIKKFLFNINKN